MNLVGRHKSGQVSVGAFVDVELRNYLDKLAVERGYPNRSDAIRTIIREHRTVFADRVDRNRALTPLDVAVNGNHHRGKK